MSPLELALSDTATVALIGIIGTVIAAMITAVVGPILIAVVNHTIQTRNEERKKSLDTIETMAGQIKALEKTVARLQSRRTGRTG
jgi:ABC-type bacteriocin/lantibiotic exporter with double-glycine peptidase domain